VSVTRPKPSRGTPIGPWFPDGARRASASRASISNSTASGSLTPPLAKILIPLSGAGLWLADSITPNSAPMAAVRCATPGVGMTPSRTTSTPDPARPATTAASRNSPDARGSRPITASGRRPSACAVPKAPMLSIAPAAATDRSMANRAVRSRPATPRTPSVPNSRAKPFTPGVSAPAALACPGPRLIGLALGVLRRLAGLLQPVLLALLDPGVAGQEAGPLEHRAVLRVDQDQRPGDAQPQR